MTTYQVRDSAGENHLVEAQAVELSDNFSRVTFYSDIEKLNPVASYVNPPSWGVVAPVAQTTDFPPPTMSEENSV